MTASIQKFIFSNTADELYPLTVRIIGNIAAQISVGDELDFKLKMVLIELLTNSLKHSGYGQTVIELSVTSDAITIKKVDKGTQLALTLGGQKITWPVTQEYIDETAIIYGDGTCTLKAIIRNHHRANFFIEEEAEPAGCDTDYITSLNEHFGLMIITRACNDFAYEFDEKTATNNFIATLVVKA